MYPEDPAVHIRSGLVKMRDIGVCNKLADFRQYRSNLFGAFGHHAHDGSGGDADTEHAAQKVMDAIDAYGPVGTEKSGQNGDYRKISVNLKS